MNPVLIMLAVALAGLMGVNRNSATFSASITDTNEHDFPNVDGSGAASGSADPGHTAWDARDYKGVHVNVVNDHDQQATLHLEGTSWSDRDSFSEAHRVVSGTTAAADGGTALLEDTDAGFDVYRLIVTYGSSPTDGSDTVSATFRNLHPM